MPPKRTNVAKAGPVKRKKLDKKVDDFARKDNTDFFIEGDSDEENRREESEPEEVRCFRVCI